MRIPSFRAPRFHWSSGNVLNDCTEYFITQYLDHFNWNIPKELNSNTYKQRYFVCGGESWKPNDPIWFYTGNEADVTLYINATGLMWENYATYNAIMVFAEHRYFGQSIPFPVDKMLANPSLYLQWLSSDQALADYAVLIETLTTAWNSTSSAVIGFGGSYGGMLCSWFRLKCSFFFVSFSFFLFKLSKKRFSFQYPQWVDGCIAGSAPIMGFMGLHPPVDDNYYAQIETYDCSAAVSHFFFFKLKKKKKKRKTAKNNIRHAWPVIFDWAKTQQGRNKLQEIFKWCVPLLTESEASGIADWVSSAISSMAMGSYPYPSSYMLDGQGYLPSYPLQSSCNQFLSQDLTTNNVSLLTAMRELAGVFYNYSGTEQCYVDLNVTYYLTHKQESEYLYNEALISFSWGYLYCTYIVLVSGQDGVNDMFWYQPWNVTQTIESCQQSYGVTPRPYWASVNYGGWGIKGQISNVVFSNGQFDPWRGGGVNVNLSDSAFAINTGNVGHHMDLMFSNPQYDPQSVIAARKFELNNIATWINAKSKFAL
ncbi:hypothetical protein RFI_33019 [Reticulomyxa filosa]|uniref:Lysosomal Pro-X carboxypeptidase n=1 Tax=Reticulomyxa filosa TaxID=46433 RepID=X6LRA5_RETFI|nr:hypothetical protein RFI_33019 [Reticulomyxa filosa]|eukprot:ETO04378.1 hypothetical protein RFI_33019 [Reticulomyxa filosa]